MQKTSILAIILSFVVISCQSTLIGQDEPMPRPNDAPKGRPRAQEDEKSKSSKQSQDRQNSGNQNSGNRNSQQGNQANQNNNSQVNVPPNQNALDSYLSSPRRLRLARHSRMFGDWFRGGVSVLAFSETPGPTNGLSSITQMPTTARIGKIAENNSALPVDRIFLNYNYFHNAIDSLAVGPVGQTRMLSPSLSKWTAGVEQTFLDGLFSLEGRVVIGNGPDFAHNPIGPGDTGYQTTSANLGNTSVIGKVLLFEDDSTAWAAGLGVELPTGGDSFVQSGGSRIELENQAIYLSPYIGLLKAPTDSPWFMNFFVQLETPLSGDGVTGTDTSNGDRQFFGRVNSQTNLFIDTGIGRWLVQNPGGLVSGLAGFFEVHANFELNDPDVLSGSLSSGPLSHDYFLNPGSSRHTYVNLTAGVHIEIAEQSKLRIGAVVPVTEERTFDTEFGFQFTQGIR